jgi:hypothetical protein
MLDVRRRQFITLLGGAAAAWALPVRAQQSMMPVIGYFSGRSPDAEAPIRVPFLKALEVSGFAAGRTTLPSSTASLKARTNVYRRLPPSSFADG